MGRISQEEAKKLCQNYLDTKSAAMDKIVGQADANAVWFDLQDLRKFLSHARRKGKQQKVVVNGVRVYFGSYDSDHQNKDLAGRTTVFFSATVAGNGLAANALDLEAEAYNMGLLGVPPKKVYYKNFF